MADEPNTEVRARYLFGDATPFPPDENFIDTLVAMAEACVSLFKADIAAESRRTKAEVARKHAGDELARVEALEGWINEAVSRLAPADPKSPSGAEAAAMRIAKAARVTVKQARAEIGKRRDAAVRVALGYKLPSQIREPVEKFMLRFQLPNTRWGVQWRAGTKTQPSQAEVRASAPHGISAEFSTALPVEGVWSRATGVAELVSRLEVSVSRGPGKPGSVLVPLHKYAITEVEASPKREALTIRKTARKPSPGYQIVIRGGSQSTPMITPIDVFGEPTGDTQAVEGEAATQLTSLWRRLLGSAPELVASRDTLATLRLGDQKMDELESPADLAEAMLQAVAPLVREMRLRSRVPGELILQRETPNGRRKELFLPREALQAKFSQLPARFARLFDGVGLGMDATTEWMSRDRELPLKPAGPLTQLEQRAAEPSDTEPHDRLDEIWHDVVAGPPGDDKTTPRSRTDGPPRGTGKTEAA
jgi:hypothetical protein